PDHSAGDCRSRTSAVLICLPIKKRHQHGAFLIPNLIFESFYHQSY
ncbi:putative membrane protein, partial [Vibrio cholerae O1 str. NHCC-008D]